MIGKRGQRKTMPSATQVTILVLLIGLAMLVYIILLPPEERATLLNETDTDFDSVTSTTYEKVLLSESPGEVYPRTESTIRHGLNDIELFSREEREVEPVADSLRVSKNWFSDKSKQVLFNIDDLDKIEEVSLFFSIRDYKGRMLLRLNGALIYDGVVNVANIPITLPKPYLRENNLLTISSQKSFFTSFYDLIDVKLIKTMRSEHKETHRSFVISPAEDEAMLSARFDYFINCIRDEGGFMKIVLNGQVLFTDIVVCDVNQPPIDIDPRRLRLGTNILDFSIDSGAYQIEDPVVEVKLSKKIYPEFRFSVDDDDFDEVQDGGMEVVLDLIFEDATDRKRAAITVNEYEFNMDTKSEDYSKDISSYVNRGANYIKFVPATTFEIKNLKVGLRD